MIDWIKNNLWQFLSSLLAGGILTITLQIAFKFVFKVSIITKIKYLFSNNHFFNGWTLNFGSTDRKNPKSKSEEVIQSTEEKVPKSPLNTKQKSICQDILKITKKYLSDTLNLIPLYEEAVQAHYCNDIALASTKYFQLFNTILKRISSFPEFQTVDGKSNINKLQYLVAGLGEMIQTSTDNAILTKQYFDCESSVLVVFANTLYE